MPASDACRKHCYEICTRGSLSRDWSQWFDGMAMSGDGKGNTLLQGELADRAALYGVLEKIRDLGLELLWLRRL